MLESQYSANNTQNIWSSIETALKQEFGDLTYRNWLSHLKFKFFENNTLTLSAPTKFIGEWIETNYLHIISKLCTHLGLVFESIQIVIEPASVSAANSNTSLNSNSVTAKLDDSQCDIFDFNLEPRFIFDNFIVGSSNKVAYSAAKAVAENKFGSTANILYIHGNVGQGKTHILQSIASYIKANDKTRKLAYLSAEKFMHMFLKYLRANDLIGFKEKIKSCDVFLVDDLQFICGKAATQQEFSNLLSSLSEANRTVVISSDSTPFALQLDARSKSRLIGGLVVEITQSDYNFRLELLRSKAVGIKIGDDVLEFIAHNIAASNREIEGALNKLIAYSSFEDSEITLESASNLLKANLDAVVIKVDINRIIDVVAIYFGIDVESIKSKSRNAKFTIPRQICAALAKSLTTKSLADIGHALGGRDHASVIYYIKQLEKKRLSSPSLDKQIGELETLLQAH